MRRGLLILCCLLWLVLPSSARVGIPVDLAWDFNATVPSGAVAQSFQIQACVAASCQPADACTPVDLSGASVLVGSTNWGTAVASGSFAADITEKTVTFSAVSAQYVRIVALSEINGNPWTSAAEFTFFVGGTQIPQSALSIVSVDSQETTGENAPATNAIDGNTITYWHTEWFNAAPPHPHEIVINLGSVVSLTSVHYLPRQVAPVNGTIIDYQIYTQTSVGLAYEDATTTGGTYYIYQVVTVGLVNGQPARSSASNQVCTYDRALHRGHPDPFGFPQ